MFHGPVGASAGMSSRAENTPSSVSFALTVFQSLPLGAKTSIARGNGLGALPSAPRTIACTGRVSPGRKMSRGV